MLIRGISLLVLGRTEAHGNEEGESDVKTLTLAMLVVLAASVVAISLGATTGDAADECLRGPNGHHRKAAIGTIASMLERTALLVSGLGRPEGALCVGADIAADSQARGAAFATDGNNRPEPAVRSPAPPAVG